MPKAQTAGAYPGFLQHEACLEVLLLPFGRDASPLQGYPKQYRRYPFIHRGNEKKWSKVRCLRKQA